MHDVASYRRILLLTGDRLGVFSSKTAAVLLRYRSADIVGIVDSAHAGKRLSEIIPRVADKPILADIPAAAKLDPDAVFVGIHPTGGALPAELRAPLRAALERGIDVVSGLHTQLSQDEELAGIAGKTGARLVDLRCPPAERHTASGRAMETRCRRILTVGSDCNVGKMVAALELTREADKRGLDARFIATGQTGMMVCGAGVAIDAVVSDFAAGAVEQLVLDASGADVCVVEGQGAIGHAGFSGVTLSILHGACPDAMILVHHAGRTHNRSSPHAPLPPLRALWSAYEQTAALLHPARIVGVALNRHEAREADVREETAWIEHEFGVPVRDPLEDGCEVLLSAALESQSSDS